MHLLKVVQSEMLLMQEYPQQDRSSGEQSEPKYGREKIGKLYCKAFEAYALWPK